MSRPLKMFMRGKSVTMLQNMLKQMGYPVSDQQGIFGATTRDAVKDFQKRKGEKVTGIVDRELLELIQKSVGFQTGKQAKPEKSAGLPDQSDPSQLQALITLLIRKGVITEAEVAEALQPETKKITEPPLF